MSDKQIEYHLQFIRQQILELRGESAVDWEAMDAALEDLQTVYEQMQMNLEAVEVVQEELLLQKQYYQDLFQFFPIASLVINTDGLIMEANQAMAQLLNVSRNSLIGKPLVVFVTKGNQSTFRTHLNQLSQSTGTQIWTISLCPHHGQPFMAQLYVAVARNTHGLIEHLRIGVYNLSPSPETIGSVIANTAIAPQLPLELAPTGVSLSQLPRSQSGLQVLVVDDEADIREFIKVLLESHNIRVRAVSSAAAALAELEQFRPDVLISDIRMPGESGYHLIRQIRALEAERGGYLPVAAITAYLDEDPEKCLQAGFEAHLYKLVQPSKWIEMVTQLAGKKANPAQDL